MSVASIRLMPIKSKSYLRDNPIISKVLKEFEDRLCNLVRDNRDVDPETVITIIKLFEGYDEKVESLLRKCQKNRGEIQIGTRMLMKRITNDNSTLFNIMSELFEERKQINSKMRQLITEFLSEEVISCTKKRLLMLVTMLFAKSRYP